MRVSPTFSISFLAVALVLGSGLLVSARGRQESPGSLSVSGVVLTPGTREPRAGVMVELAGPDRTAAERNRGEKQQTMRTDTAGRFRFDDLLPGVYVATALQPFQEGQIRNDVFLAGRSESQIELSEGVIPGDVQVWMPLLSALCGRVLGPDLGPLEGASVSPHQIAWDEGRRLMNAPDSYSAMTDEAGAYTIYVAPGEYYLHAVPRLHPELQPLNSYYPSVAGPEDAVPVRVRGGASLNGLDITLRDRPRLRIRFELVLPDFLPGATEPLPYDVDGEPILELVFRPVARDRSLDLGPFRSGMSIERLAEDLWQTSPVVEGDYELRLSYSGALRRAFDEVEWDHRLFPVASFAVSVDSDSAGDEGTIELGEIAGGSRSTVTGRLVFEGPGANGVVPSALPAMWLTDPRSGGPMIPFTDDGAFVLDGLAAGLYRFSPAPHFLSLPDGLFVSAVRSAGRSVLDEGLLVGGGANPVEIVISDGAARIEGIVRRGEGDLVPGARVILVPPAEGRGPITHFRNAPASATGFYELDGVSPGEYRVLALDLAGRTFGNPFWEDPDFLRQYELRGERITVDPGARLRINPEAIPLVD